MERKHDWWRWPLVPFVGVVAGALGAVAFGLLQWIGMKFYGGFSEDGWFFMYILPTMTSAVFGYAFVASTHYVAPKGKVISAVVMTTLLGLFFLLSVVLAWGTYKQSTAESVKTTVGCVAALVAAIATLVSLAGAEGKSA